MIMRNVLAIGLGGVILVACGGQQGAQPRAGIVPAEKSVLSLVTPDHGRCVSTNGVKTTPCPVRLTKKHKVVEITISGQGVVNSNIGYREGSCNNYCYFKRVNATKWDAYAGSVCGSIELAGEGLNGSGLIIGYGYFKLINKYCP